MGDGILWLETHHTACLGQVVATRSDRALAHA